MLFEGKLESVYFLISWPEFAFLWPQKSQQKMQLTGNSQRKRKYYCTLLKDVYRVETFDCSLGRFTKHFHPSIFSPLHPWQTVESVYFQPLLFLLYFTFIKCLSRGLDLHPSVYEQTFNRWGEDTEERKDKEQPLSNLWRLFVNVMCSTH